jgi:hypothetical protein
MPLDDESIPTTGSFPTLLHEYAGALASQPFLERWPAILADVVPHLATRTLHGADGSVIPLDAGFRHILHLAALSGGHPVGLAGEWDGESFLPLSAWHEGRLLNFDAESLV